MHHDGVWLGQLQMLQTQPVEREIFARREGRFVLALQLDAQHHDDVGVANGFVHVGGQGHAGREMFQFRRQQRRGSAQHDIGAVFRKQKHVGARHAAVRDIADDGDAQAFELLAAVENRARIEQRLRGMLVRAVAGVDDGNSQVALQKVRRAGGRSGA